MPSLRLAAGITLLAVSAIMILIGQRQKLVATNAFKMYGVTANIGYTIACLIVFIVSLALIF
jgi:hypothetical protein